MGVNGIYGLSGSGLDIESMVKVGMLSKQNEYDKMAQKFTQNEWKKTAYLDISSQITTFNLSALTDYKMSSSTNAKIAESSDENAVKATANATAAAMNHRVDVKSLSTNAYLISNKSISKIVEDNGGTSGSIKLQDILFKNLTTKPTVTTDYSGGTIANGTTTTNFGTGNPSIETVTNADGSTTSTAKGLNDDILFTATKDADGTTHYRTKDGSQVNLTSGGALTYSSATGSSTTVGVNFTASEQKLTFGDGVTFTRNRVDGSAEIKFGTMTFAIGSDKKISSMEVTDSTGGGSPTTTKYDVAAGSITTDGTTSSTSVTASEVKTINFTSGDLISVTLTTTTNADGTKTANATITHSGTFTPDYKIAASTTDGDGNKVTTLTGGKINSDGSIEFGDFSDSDLKYLKLALSDDSSTVSITERKEGISGTTVAGTDVTTADNFLTKRDGGTTVKSTDTAIAFSIGDNKNGEAKISFTYGDILGGKTINDLVSEINTKTASSGINVRASYDNISGRFYLYNSKSGKEDEIQITALTTSAADTNGSTTAAGTVAKDFFNALNLYQSKDGGLVAPEGYGESGLQISSIGTKASVAGYYGSVLIDGVPYDSIEDNKLTVGGVTYNFTNTTGTTDSAGNYTAVNPVTVTVTQDVDAIVDKVKSFVESYNKILSSLYEKYDEKNDSNYKPLTQSQKDSMKDEQIEKWEEKAKQGLLYHDSTIGKIINDMRNTISATVEGINTSFYNEETGSYVTYNSIYSLGVSTTGIKGQLELDETKLRKALAVDPDAVYNILSKPFTNKTDPETGRTLTDSEIKARNGIAQQLSDVFSDATKLIKNRAGSSSDITEDSDLNNLLRELQTKMSNFKKLMNSFEDKLYKKYDAMEVALAKLGTQLNFITGGQ